MEEFDVVNEKDEVIGKATREECHNDNTLIHRGVNILLINDKGDWLFQKRHVSKDLEGGKWDLSATGHNDLGENYEETAKRELEEELNLKDIELKMINKMFSKTEIQSEFHTNFVGKFNGNIKDVKFNTDEISEIRFLTKKEIKDIYNNEKETFVSWMKNYIEWFKDYLGD